MKNTAVQQLSSLANQNLYKQLLTESQKHLIKNKDNFVCLTFSIYAKFSLSMKSEGLGKELELFLNQKLEGNKDVIPEWEMHTASSLICEFGLSNQLVEYCIKLIKLNKSITYSLDLYIRLALSCVWELQFTAAKKLLIMIQLALPKTLPAQKILETKIAQILYSEFFYHFYTAKKNSNKISGTILKLLIAKLKKITSFDIYFDSHFVYASLLHENNDFEEGYAVLEKQKSILDGIEKNSFDTEQLQTMIQLSEMSLALKSKEYSKVLEIIKLLIDKKKIDSSFLEQIFDTEQSDFNKNSETINNFFSEMQSHFDNEWAANESTEFRQLKIIFDVCCAISNLKRDQLKKSDACTLLFEKIQLYLELFDTKPFCSNDVYSLMNLIGDRCEAEIFQKVASDLKTKIENDKLKTFDLNKGNIQQYENYISCEFFLSGFGDTNADNIEKNSKKFQSLFKNYIKSNPKYSSEEIYSYNSLLLTLANRMSCLNLPNKTVNFENSLLSLSLIQNTLNLSPENDFFAFTLRKHFSACQLGLPWFVKLDKDLDLNDTQFEALLYLFFDQMRSPMLSIDFSEFLDHLNQIFRKIRSQALDFVETCLSENSLMLIEDSSQFLVKTILSKNKYLIQRYSNCYRSMKMCKISEDSKPHDDIPEDLQDLSDFSPIEIFIPLRRNDNVPLVKFYDEKFNELIAWLGAIGNGFTKFFDYFNSTHNIDPKFENLNDIEKRLDGLLLGENPIEFTRFCSDLICLLHLAKSVNKLQKKISNSILDKLARKLCLFWDQNVSKISDMNGKYCIETKATIEDINKHAKTIGKFILSYKSKL